MDGPAAARVWMSPWSRKGLWCLGEIFDLYSNPCLRGRHSPLRIDASYLCLPQLMYPRRYVRQPEPRCGDGNDAFVTSQHTRGPALDLLLGDGTTVLFGGADLGATDSAGANAVSASRHGGQRIVLQPAATTIKKQLNC